MKNYVKSYIKSNFPVLLIVLFVSLLLASVTFAWFIRITQTNANEMQMKIVNDSLELIETDEEDFALVDEEGFVCKENERAARAISVPGDKARFRALLKNTSEGNVYFDEIGLSKAIILAPNATPEEGVYYDEIPTDEYYYGTQLKVSLVGLYTGTEEQLAEGIGEGTKELYKKADPNDNVDDSISGIAPTREGTFLLQYKNPAKIGEGVDSTRTILAKFGDKKLTLEPGECLAVYIEVEFVESGEDQNVYRFFGRKGTGEVCRRSIYVVLC